MPEVPWEAVLSAMPALAGAFRLTRPKGLARRIARLDRAIKTMTDGPLKSEAQTELNRLGAEMAYRESRAARRSTDASAAAAIIFILALAITSTWVLLQFGIVFKILAVIIALTSTMLIAAGATTSLFKTDEHFSFEKKPDPSPEDSTRPPHPSVVGPASGHAQR